MLIPIAISSTQQQNLSKQADHTRPVNDAGDGSAYNQSMTFSDDIISSSNKSNSCKEDVESEQIAKSLNQADQLPELEQEQEAT